MVICSGREVENGFAEPGTKAYGEPTDHMAVLLKDGKT